MYGSIENIFEIYNTIAKIWQYMMDKCETSINDYRHIGVNPAVSRYKNNFEILSNKDKEIYEHVLKEINGGTLPKYTGFFHSYSSEDSNMTKVVCMTVILAEFDKPKNPIPIIDRGYFSDSHFIIDIYLDKNIFLFNIENNAQINAEENCIDWFTELFQYTTNAITEVRMQLTLSMFLASLFVGGALNRSANKMVQLFKNNNQLNMDISYFDFDELEVQFEKIIKIQEINSPIINLNMDIIKRAITSLEHIDYKNYLKNNIHAKPAFDFTFKKNPLFEEDDESDSGLISEE